MMSPSSLNLNVNYPTLTSKSTTLGWAPGPAKENNYVLEFLNGHIVVGLLGARTELLFTRILNPLPGRVKCKMRW
jgi:hypothetical protein